MARTRVRGANPGHVARTPGTWREPGHVVRTRNPGANPSTRRKAHPPPTPRHLQDLALPANGANPSTRREPETPARTRTGLLTDVVTARTLPLDLDAGIARPDANTLGGVDEVILARR